MSLTSTVVCSRYEKLRHEFRDFLEQYTANQAHDDNVFWCTVAFLLFCASPTYDETVDNIHKTKDNLIKFFVNKRQFETHPSKLKTENHTAYIFWSFVHNTIEKLDSDFVHTIQQVYVDNPDTRYCFWNFVNVLSAIVFEGHKHPQSQVWSSTQKIFLFAFVFYKIKPLVD